MSAKIFAISNYSPFFFLVVKASVNYFIELAQNGIVCFVGYSLSIVPEPYNVIKIRKS